MPIINLLLVLVMLIHTPRDAFKWKPSAIYIFTLSYMLMFLHLLTTPVNNKGALTKYDLIVIMVIMVWTLFKPYKWVILKRTDLVEFDVVYRLIYLILIWYYSRLRQIDISFQFSWHWWMWLITIIITIALISASLWVAVKTRLYRVCFGEKINRSKILVVSVYMFYFVALSQEYTFRGLVFSYLKQFLPENYLAIVIGSSLLFGLVHLKYAGWKMVIVSSIAGVGYGLIYHLTGNLFFPVVSHTLTNLFWKTCLRGNN